MRRLFALVALILAVQATAASAQAYRENGAGGQLLTASGQCATLDVSGMGRGAVTVAGSHGGTVTWYVTTQGGERIAIDAFTPDAPTTAVNSTVGTGTWSVDVAGLRVLLACLSGSPTGTAQVFLSAAATGGGGGGAGVGDIGTGLDTTATNTGNTATATQNIYNAMIASPDAQQGQNFPGSGVPLYGRYDSTAPTGVSDGQGAAIRTNDLGELITNENNSAAALTALQLIDNAQTGDTPFYRTSAGSTEDEHEVKATAGTLYSVAFTNTNAAARYWRCSNLTAANTTPGTSTVFIGLAIPGNTAGAGFTHTFGPNGIAFSTALTCWFVTGAADTDVAEVAANEIKALYSYK